VTARTGEVEEYAVLPSKMISAELTGALTAWMKNVLAARK
jgi:hypothetical protein